MKTLKICFALLLVPSLTTSAQEIMNLYHGSVPNSKEASVKETGEEQHSGMFSGVTKPTLEIFLPEKEKSTGAAVVICPGGGYSVVVFQAEGVKTAKEFAKNGVAAFGT